MPYEKDIDGFDIVASNGLETVTGTAPSDWASYLINGDDSGLDVSEKALADRFVEFLGDFPVSCADAGFMWRHDASRFGVLGADCQEYTALIKV
jgi:hypothetical protein